MLNNLKVKNYGKFMKEKNRERTDELLRQSIKGNVMLTMANSYDITYLIILCQNILM